MYTALFYIICLSIMFAFLKNHPLGFGNLSFNACFLMLLSMLSFQSFAMITSDHSTAAIDVCTDCHQEQVHNWQKSDHAKAMALATKDTVLGDFNNAETKHFTQTARFYKKGNEFWAEHGYNDKLQAYKIIYTFGHFPLQQYLVDHGNGKLQVFPFAWDSRKKADGGQRWYANYLDEDILPNDRLHWLQPLQNWNGMCADCHSDGLKRNYSSNDNSFNTTWDNINVGCQSCHGKMTEHAKAPKTNSKSTKNAKYTNQWLIEAGKATATWQGEKRDNQFMDGCFACHALRSPLTDGIKHDQAFLDQFSPSFLQPNLYHADGQIKEEVYVYGSFLQSKMYKAGVNCLDCHDQHTMKIKLPDNTLCAQCHNNEIFNKPEHHGHQANSTGSLCVNCHMPENRYMGVDDRRDHSFKIPRPHLSEQFQTPNACVQCHEEKDNSWAAQNIKKWHGSPKALTSSEQTYMALQQGQQVPLAAHLALINDINSNDIIRATALSLLPNSTPTLTDQDIKNWVGSKVPLIRLALASIGQIIAPEERTKSFQTLLDDKYKAVRTAAANHLITIPNINKAQLNKAFNELVTANDVSAWRGEGNLNHSILELMSGNNSKAIAHLKKAINVDPYFPASYINLADLYRNIGDIEQEKQTYLAALKAVPNSDLVHYSYGLYQIRLKQVKSSIASFTKALKLQPNNSQYAYIYILALDNTGETKKALAQLKMISGRFSHDGQLLQLGLTLAQKMRDQQAYQYFYNKLQALPR